ncbi:transposable element Tcb1 transposase [Trichonephila clavipes]|nr:transposable element Tcb1 transposase [Trichonephila clavipes]
MGRCWISLSHSSSMHCRYFKQPALHLQGVGDSCPFHIFRAWPQPYFNKIMRDHTWSMNAQRMTQITPPAATPDQLWQRAEAAWFAVPQEHIQSFFESMPRRVAVGISNNGGYSGY